MKIYCLATAVFMLAAFPLIAHHSFAMFELTKDVTYEGTVVEYNWENPHTHIIVKVDPGAADPSTVGTWDVERGATNHGPTRVDTRYIQTGRPHQGCGASHERWIERRVAVLRHHAGREAALSRHRTP